MRGESSINSLFPTKRSQDSKSCQRQVVNLTYALSGRLGLFSVDFWILLTFQTPCFFVVVAIWHEHNSNIHDSSHTHVQIRTSAILIDSNAFHWLFSRVQIVWKTIFSYSVKMIRKGKPKTNIQWTEERGKQKNNKIRNKNLIAFNYLKENHDMDVKLKEIYAFNHLYSIKGAIRSIWR